jgi:hypothetical protein
MIHASSTQLRRIIVAAMTLSTVVLVAAAGPSKAEDMALLD